MEHKEILQGYREQIDTIDQELVSLLARRMQVVQQVGEYKKEYNVTPLQPGRWQKVLDKVRDEARNLLLDDNFVQDIWNRIHEEALRLEKK